MYIEYSYFREREWGKEKEEGRREGDRERERERERESGSELCCCRSLAKLRRARRYLSIQQRNRCVAFALANSFNGVAQL